MVTWEQQWMLVCYLFEQQARSWAMVVRQINAHLEKRHYQPSWIISEYTYIYS